MSNEVENEVVETEVVETPVEESIETPTEEVLEEDKFQAAVDAKLAGMKASMDRMAKERDDALKVKNQMEADTKTAKIAKLEEEGKLQELAEMKIADLTAKLSVFEKENTKLNRDSILGAEIAKLEFRSDRSREMAKKDVLDQLVQNEDGAWKHTSGASIADFVESYSKEESNSFLFRVKSNSGSGATTSSSSPIAPESKALSDMSTEEVLRLAAKGQLGNFNI